MIYEGVLTLLPIVGVVAVVAAFGYSAYILASCLNAQLHKRDCPYS